MTRAWTQEGWSTLHRFRRIHGLQAMTLASPRNRKIVQTGRIVTNFG